MLADVINRSPLLRLLGSLVTLGAIALVALTVGTGPFADALDGIEDATSPGQAGALTTDEMRAAVARIGDEAGEDARITSVALRAGSAEFDVIAPGGDRQGYVVDSDGELTTTIAGIAPMAGPFDLAQVDPAAPERMLAAIERRLDGETLALSIATLERASISGKLEWVVRGTDGGEGLAFEAGPDGRGLRPFDPTD